MSYTTLVGQGTALPADVQEEVETEVKSFGGKAEFWDAVATAVEDISVPPHWDAKRRTGVVASVAIDRGYDAIAGPAWTNGTSAAAAGDPPGAR